MERCRSGRVYPDWYRVSIRAFKDEIPVIVLAGHGGRKEAVPHARHQRILSRGDDPVCIDNGVVPFDILRDEYDRVADITAGRSGQPGLFLVDRRDHIRVCSEPIRGRKVPQTGPVTSRVETESCVQGYRTPRVAGGCRVLFLLWILPVAI